MQNLLIDSITESDRALLLPLLQPSRLDQQTLLHEMGDPVSSVYFPTGAVVSLVIALSSGETVEAAMIGRDGVIGASSALDGGNVAMSRAIVQLGGSALVCGVSSFKQAVLRSPTLLAKIVRHEQMAFAQAQQSAACIASHNIESRLARWLLRARDLADSDTLPFTQEYLADMLGVRRTSVSVVAHTLQQAGMIHYRRGKIQITDLDALQQTACECYLAVKEHYHRLLGPRSRS